MVPADCSLCKRSLMIWDVTTFWCRRQIGIGEIKICNDCLPKEAIENDEDMNLDFKFREQEKWDIHVPVQKEPESVGFTGPELGSEDRFVKRKHEVPWLTHTFWWLVHNCVSHPLIGILPLKPLFRFHDWTSYRMHGR